MYLPMPGHTFLFCFNYYSPFQELFNLAKMPVFTQHLPYVPQQINSLIGYVFNVIFVHPSAFLWRELVSIQSSAALQPNKRTRVGKQSSHKEKQNFKVLAALSGEMLSWSVYYQKTWLVSFLYENLNHWLFSLVKRLLPVLALHSVVFRRTF